VARQSPKLNKVKNLEPRANQQFYKYSPHILTKLNFLKLDNSALPLKVSHAFA
jgi:hypothetical protein